MKQCTLFIFFVSLTSFVIAQNWLTAGNNGTNPPTNFLGTIDSKAIVFKTANIERARILSGGNMGIGLTNPLQKFDVNGNINIG